MSSPNSLSFLTLFSQSKLSYECCLVYVYRIILIALAAQMLLSWPLWWTTTGWFPYLPLIATTGEWLEKSSLILFPVFLILLIVNFVYAEKTRYLKFLFVCGFFLIIGNLHRVQVWFYFYGLLLSLFLNRKNVSLESVVFVGRLVLVGVYSWSGLHKFNVHFVGDIFPWLMEPLGFTKYSFPVALAYLAGGVEVFIGIGLLWKPTRNLAIFVCLIFHLLILGLLGPLGHNWNPVVWPWNVAMPILVYLFFYKTAVLRSQNLLNVCKQFPSGFIVLFLVWVLPAFNYLNITPEQLSFKMYAGSQPEMVLFYGDQDQKLLNINSATFGNISPDELPLYRVELDGLAFAEWGTPPFTTTWTARKILRQFCQKMQQPEKGGILYLENDKFLTMKCNGEVFE